MYQPILTAKVRVMSDAILVTSDRLNLFLIKKSSSFSDRFASLCIFITPGNMEDFSGFGSESGSGFSPSTHS